MVKVTVISPNQEPHLLLCALDTKPNELSLKLCETHLFAIVWTEESVALCESKVGTLS